MNYRELLAQILASAERLQEQREVRQKHETNRDMHRALLANRKQNILEMEGPNREAPRNTWKPR